MIIINLLLFLLALFILVKAAEYSTSYSSKIAGIFHLSEFLVSFFIVAVISVFPEGTISIFSAVNNVPQFGLGTLLGSNVADLTLVFGVVALISGRGIRVRSVILKRDILYLLLLVFPVILGLDGEYSRVEGVLLMATGLFFFFTLSIEGHMFKVHIEKLRDKSVIKKIFFLLISLGILLISGYYTVEFGVRFANEIGVPAILVSLTIVSVGSCLPELMFSIKAVKANHDALAMGDIMGTVITDATIVLGIMILIRPFYFNPMLIYITGAAMILAALLIILFVTTGRLITKKEAILLLVFYAFYLIVEFIGNKVV